jgi:hypothetical protein
MKRAMDAAIQAGRSVNRKWPMGTDKRQRNVLQAMRAMG